jgi:hypothetical protein
LRWACDRWSVLHYSGFSCYTRRSLRIHRCKVTVSCNQSAWDPSSPVMWDACVCAGCASTCSFKSWVVFLGCVCVCVCTCEVKSCCCSWRPSLRSQDRTVLSSPPVHSLVPSLEMSIQLAPSVWPWNCLCWTTHVIKYYKLGQALNADWLTAMVYQTIYHRYDKTFSFTALMTLVTSL